MTTDDTEREADLARASELEREADEPFRSAPSSGMDAETAQSAVRKFSEASELRKKHKKDSDDEQDERRSGGDAPP